MRVGGSLSYTDVSWFMSILATIGFGSYGNLLSKGTNSNLELFTIGMYAFGKTIISVCYYRKVLSAD